MDFLYLYGLVALEGILLIAELTASQLTHSLIILTDGYHTLYNILSILCLIISLKMSNEKTVKNTFGWARIEVLGMLVNMTFLVALTFSLLVEGIQQLVHSSHEISEPTSYYLLINFGVCGLVSNLLHFNIVSDAISCETKQRNECIRPEEKIVLKRSDSLRTQEKIVFNDVLGLNIEMPSSSGQQELREVNEKLLSIQSNKEENISSVKRVVNNQQNVFYGMFRDLTGSVLLIFCGITIIYTTDTFAHLSDPIFGMVSAVLFVITLYPNMKDTGYILLQTVPQHIDIGTLQQNLLKEFPIILNIHDMHVWGLNASRTIATCHIILPKQSIDSFDEFSKQLKMFFRNQGIVWATVQPEFAPEDDHVHTDGLTCLMKCSKQSGVNCDSLKCCINEENENKLKNRDNCEDFVEIIATNDM